MKYCEGIKNMVKDDIDQLQSFGAKITQKNQTSSLSSKKIKQKNKNFKKQNLNIIFNIKNKIKCFYNKNKHTLKRWRVKLHAHFSPSLIKLQTFSNGHKKNGKKVKYQQKHLIEKRKRFGNTIIVIRTWKKAPSNVMNSIPTDLQHVYYFHKKNQQQSHFQPKTSIWDVPIDDDR